ncbi:MAG: heme NO-binding domain-containing protein, partial [Pseudomonadota bacterium]
MKGIVFDEFTEMVEEVFGDDMLDDILDENADKLSSGGAYTSVGTYDHNDLVTL